MMVNFAVPDATANDLPPKMTRSISGLGFSSRLLTIDEKST